jgi:hypothetical protein
MTNPVENKIIHAADFVEPSAEFSQALWNQIRTTPRNETTPKRISRFVWIPALTVLGILVVMILVSPQTVMAAVKGLLAYLPGVGFVEKDESTLYLEKPVVVEQGGYTFTLDQVVADKNKVAVAYHIANPDSNFDWCAYNGNFLIWPDGKSNRPIGGGSGPATEGSVSAQIDYFPLPSGVKEASLKVSTEDPDSRCLAPIEWDIPFTLGTEAPDTEILPVVENVAEQTLTPLVSKTKDAPIQLTVDTVDELADGYLIAGHIDYDNKFWTNVSIKTSTLYALDANGKNVAIEQGNASFNVNGFDIKITDKDFKAPLSIHVKDLYIQAVDENGSSFSFDAGSSPQLGQSWKINQELTYAGNKFTVHEVKVINGDYDFDPKTIEIAYGISMKLPEGFGVLMDCVGQDDIHSIGNVAKPVIDGEYTAEVDYKDGIPNGKVTCKAINSGDQESGDWQFDWQPPAATHSNSASTSSSDSTVRFIVDKYVEMADGYLLTGRMISQDSSWRQISINMGTIFALDAAGKNVPLEQTDISVKDNEFAIKITSKEFTSPIAIHVKQLNVNAFEDNGPFFSFDAGSDPQVDQSWKINQELEIADMKILVKNIQVIEELDEKGLPTGKKGFAMLLNYAERVDPYINCENMKMGSSGSSGSKPLGGNDYLFETIYSEGLPNGEITCTLAGAMFYPTGDWQFTWQPAPAAK